MSSNDLTMNSGDTKIISVVVRNSNGSLQDISNAAIKWQLARYVNSIALVTKSISSGIMITDAANGVFQITISPLDTDGLGGKEYYHEAEIKLADGTVSTIISGTVTMVKTLIRTNHTFAIFAIFEDSDSISINGTHS
jgi:hypothetical protein